MVNLDQLRAAQYNPYRRQLANPLRYAPYELKKVNEGLTVTNPTTEFWTTAMGPAITIQIVQDVLKRNQSVDSLQDLRR